MRRILAELPETLDETYERILQEIPKSNRVHAHRLLQCLAVAVRPLRVEELAEVLAVDFDATGGIPKLNEDLRWEDQEQAVLSACSSLIAVVWDDDFRVVQFSHFSVKEFLTSDRLATSTIIAARDCHILLETSHTIMAQACLSVLLRLDYNIDEDGLKDFPLARYASQYVGDHAEFENVFAHIRNEIDDLLDADKPTFATWLWVRRGNFLVPPKRPEASPLYHIAEFGFRAMVDHLISKRPEDLNVRGYVGIPLHAALCNGHGSVALLLLTHCADVDVRGFDDRTPLHMAVDRGLLDVTRVLIERNASINARDSSGRTPLHPTFDFGSGAPFDDTYFDVMRYLLEHGIDADAQANTEYSTPLHLASYHGGFKVAQLLLDNGADVNMRNKNGQTPLHGTLVGMTDGFDDYYFDAVRFLLEHGADIHALDNDHGTPLHAVAQSGSTKAARLLLRHGADVHSLNNMHSTPLHFALKSGNAELTRLLLEHGADVHALNDNHSTPLHFIGYDDRDAAATRVLLEYGAVIDARDNNDSTPLHVASQCGNTEVARVLIEHGADVHALDGNHSTPLHFASESGNSELTRLLLEHGADVHILNNSHSTPLHYISQYTGAGAARVLLERGAAVDSRDNEDSTPLHVALQCGNADVVGLLLEHGADTYVRNKADQTPQHLLLASCRNMLLGYGLDTIQIFLERGIDVDAVDDNHSTLLHWASYYRSVKVAQLLLERGANINARNEEGHTPLHRAPVGFAINMGPDPFDMMQLLLEHGADIDALDVAHMTPLHLASQSGCIRAIRLLIEHGANVHLQNDDGHTPSQVASANDYEGIARLLSDHSQSEQNM